MKQLRQYIRTLLVESRFKQMSKKKITDLRAHLQNANFINVDAGGDYDGYLYDEGTTLDFPAESGGDFYVVAAIPEPATVGLIALSSTGLMLMRSKKKFKFCFPE